MEQNKIETQFKEQLNSREIKPSEMAWDRLDAMLTVAEEKKSKPGYSWLYIAASIMGFVFFGTVYFSQSDENVIIEGKEVVVENNQKVMQKKDVISIIPLHSKSETRIVISEVKIEKKNSRDTNSILKNKKQVVQSSNTDNLIPIIEKNLTDQKTEQFVSSNINEKSVDEMLASVKTTSKARNLKTTIKVNPNALLSQVDGELELSFREKVINKVNKNYQTVKVALANRNQE